VFFVICVLLLYFCVVYWAETRAHRGGWPGTLDILPYLLTRLFVWMYWSSWD